MELWVVWTLLAVLMFVGEMLTAGFFLLWIGIGALLGAGLSLLGLGLPWQLLGFAVGSGALIVSSRKLYERLFGGRGRPRLSTNVDAMVDAVGTVIKAVDNDRGGGLVRVRGEDWTAFAADDIPIPEGKRVQVVRVDGVRLIVIEQP